MVNAAHFSVSHAWGQLPTIIDQVCATHEPVYLTRRGEPIAALIDYDDLQTLIGMAQEARELLEAEESRARASLKRQLEPTG